MKSDKDKVEKRAELLKKVTKDPNIIPGIHNYCDRWCERCTHTKHCSVYLMEQEIYGPVEDREGEEETLLEDLSTMFQVTAKLLNEQMEEMGIDPNNLPEVEEEEPYDPKDTEPVKVSSKYTKDMADWLKQNREKVKSKFDQLASINEEKALELADAYEVVQYYFMMISTKTYRAMIPQDPDIDSGDDRGSAKIALILIDKSTTSWLKLMAEMPEFEDDALKLLMQLSQVKKLLLEQFPNAMEFVRPGFDE